MKTIRLSLHAREQLFFRGTTEEEIIETIGTSQWELAELERFQCKKRKEEKGQVSIINKLVF